jgi:hypothetical protein
MAQVKVFSLGGIGAPCCCGTPTPTPTLCGAGCTIPSSCHGTLVCSTGTFTCVVTSGIGNFVIPTSSGTCGNSPSFSGANVGVEINCVSGVFKFSVNDALATCEGPAGPGCGGPPPAPFFIATVPASFTCSPFFVEITDFSCCPVPTVGGLITSITFTP